MVFPQVAPAVQQVYRYTEDDSEDDLRIRKVKIKTLRSSLARIA
jgi:hypothetical protein